MNLWAAILLALATASCHLGCYAQTQDIPPSYGVEALQQRLWIGRTKPLKAATMGDSVGIGLFEALVPTFHAAFGVNGAVSAAEYTGRGMWAGPVCLSGGTVLVERPTTNWFSLHFNVPVGGIITWTNLGALDSSVLADTASLSYVAGPGYGAFKLLKSRNNSDWQELAVIDANEPVRRGACLRFALPLDRYKLRVEGLQGTSVILNAGLWNESSSGLRTTELFNNGISIATITSTPEAIWKPVFNDLQLDILFWEMKDCHGDVTTNQFVQTWPVFASMLERGFPGALIVLVGTTPQFSGTPLLAWQNAYVRNQAIERGWVYWDGYSPFGSYETAVANNWVTDLTGVHPSKLGNSVRAKALMNQIGLGPVKLLGASTGNVQVQARGLPGIQFLLQSSTDLSAWENKATNTFTKSELIHSQPYDENAPALFFRTVIVPE